MRLTIIAGLIMGASLAIQSMLAAHATVGHVHVVAPWYIAATDRPCDERIGGVRDAAGSLSS